MFKARNLMFSLAICGLLAANAVVAQTPALASKYPGTVHLLPATLETTQWGWFDNAQPPVLTVNSGDTVVMETMMHAHNQVVPGKTIEELKKLRTDNPGRGPHTVTGPIFVTGAEPGDVLKVKIQRIVPRAYGTNFNIPGMFGQFPKDFQDGQVKYVYLDMDRMTAEFLPGITIPLKPFPGTIGVARAEPGRYSTVPPGEYAGNMDIRELSEGATLYVPIWVKGALLWSGDSHAAQGNGEVNLTAIETAYKELAVTLDVVKGIKLDFPRIETPSAWITMGFDKDLNLALEQAKRLAPSVRAFAEAAGPVTTADALELLERDHGLAGIEARRAWRGARVRAHVLHHHETALWNARPEGRFVAVDEPATHDPTDARAEVFRRYLAAFGPASRRDIVAWAMMRVAEVDRALARLDLRRFRDERGRELLDVPRAPLPDPETPAPVRFLPKWDNVLLAFADRTRVLPEVYRRRVIGMNGDVAQTFLVDGLVAGTWSYDRGRIAIEPFAPLSRATRAELAEEGERLQALYVD